MTSIKRLLNDEDGVFTNWPTALDAVHKHPNVTDPGLDHSQLPLYFFPGNGGLDEGSLALPFPANQSWAASWDAVPGYPDLNAFDPALEGLEDPNEVHLPTIVQDDIELWTADTFLPSEEILSPPSSLSASDEAFEHTDFSVCFGMVRFTRHIVSRS